MCTEFPTGQLLLVCALHPSLPQHLAPVISHCEHVQKCLRDRRWGSLELSNSRVHGGLALPGGQKGLSLLPPATITAHLRLALSPTVSSTKECQRLGQEICVGPFLLLAGQLNSDLHRC